MNTPSPDNPDQMTFNRCHLEAEPFFEDSWWHFFVYFEDNSGGAYASFQAKAVDESIAVINTAFSKSEIPAGDLFDAVVKASEELWKPFVLQKP